MDERMDEKKRNKKNYPAAAASPPPWWDCGSPLYDAFELASVYRVLDNHLMALPFALHASRSPPRPRDRDGGRPRAARDADVALQVPAGSRKTLITSSAAAWTRAASRRRRAAARTRTTGVKAVLHSICRSVTCSRKL